MTRPIMLILVVSTAALAGCQSANQTLDQEQAAAMQVAVNRGQFELNCPAATGSVLSRNLLNPMINATGPMGGGISGEQRAEYQIGVSGCGQREVVIAVCQIGSVSCVAVEPRK